MCFICTVSPPYPAYAVYARNYCVGVTASVVTGSGVLVAVAVGVRVGLGETPGVSVGDWVISRIVPVGGVVIWGGVAVFDALFWKYRNPADASTRSSAMMRTYIGIFMRITPFFVIIDARHVPCGYSPSAPSFGRASVCFARERSDGLSLERCLPLRALA